eukprot:12764621-Ditylum_brightwellii.AAC.1
MNTLSLAGCRGVRDEWLKPLVSTNPCSLAIAEAAAAAAAQTANKNSILTATAAFVPENDADFNFTAAASAVTTGNKSNCAVTRTLMHRGDSKSSGENEEEKSESS